MRDEKSRFDREAALRDRDARFLRNYDRQRSGSPCCTECLADSLAAIGNLRTRTVQGEPWPRTRNMPRVYKLITPGFGMPVHEEW